ncbi:RodZ domain-containing protein [Alishewanella sp. d11]|uniref:RodZ domain-containing protein n=1 Tax=Alishewanella sp. d11 TaxID=3414030 RepID=UPI003BF8DAA9
MSNNEQAPPTELAELSVGQILQQERARRSFTLQFVAKQLNLKVEVLQSLEADQPDKSILPTFMRGYVRSYARFLKLPEQQLLTRFEQAHKVQSSPVKVMKTFSNRQAKQQTEARFMWLTYVIAAILLASFAIWLWQGARDFTGFADNQLQSDTLIVEETNLPLQDNILQTESANNVENAPVNETATDITPVAEVPVETDITQPVDAAAAMIEPALPVASLEPPLQSSVLEQNDADLDRLKMTFSDNCWIDVLDSKGERIAFGTKQGGYVMELNAQGPFTITLGNPGVVSIEINGQLFDMSRFPGGRVAKFTLAGQDE